MRVLVTGGTGFLGQYVTRELERRGHEAFPCGRADADLTLASSARDLLRDYEPDGVIHLAANVGGINYNRDHPAALWRDNLLMGVNVLHACVQEPVRRLVLVGTCCSYPSGAPLPLGEESLWEGYPERTNAPYGVAKRVLLVGADAYRKEYSLDVGSVIPANLYGAGDTFGPRAHVLADLVRKVVEARLAGLHTIPLQGTGRETRDFLHAADAARGVVLMLERFGLEGPVNLGTGVELSIADAATLVAQAAGWDGTFAWHAAGPRGQHRRVVDASYAERVLGWRASVVISEGVREMVAWYEKEVCQA